MFKILLLTNRDSDNTGDQILELCDLALIDAAMANLGLPKNCYEVSGRALSTFMKDFFKTGDEKLLKRTRRKLEDTDLVIFGGTPVFNYTYQDFSEWTVKFLEFCQKQNVPVIMSAVGIEYYDEKNEKCRRLKEAINLPVVRQITTRDDLESLKKMKMREDLVIGKVADPAVFAPEVFADFKAEEGEKGQQKIGLCVLRAQGFRDHGYKMSMKKAASFWKELYEELNRRGYEAEFFTNGHYDDEAFMDRLVRDYDIPYRKAKFNINKPEDLIARLSGYDGIVSCRLHPNILAAAYGIPAVGLLWNMKVQGFYDAIDRGDQVIPADRMQASYVADRLVEVMKSPAGLEESYRMSVYETLYGAIKTAVLEKDEFPLLQPEKTYTYENLSKALPRFKGTDEQEQFLKLRRKFRRMYGSYNKYQNVIDLLESVPFLKQIYKKQTKDNL